MSTKTTSKFPHLAAAFSGSSPEFLPTPSHHPLLKIRRGGRGPAADPSTLSEQQLSCRCELIHGKRGSSVYDALGRRTAEINGLGSRTTTAYNAVGQTSALVDARGKGHSFTYDSPGAQTQLIDPLNRRRTSAYDAAGQQNLRIDARSNRTTYAYSTVGQLTSRKYPDG